MKYNKLPRSKATFKTNTIHNGILYFLTIQKSKKTEHTTPEEIMEVVEELKCRFPSICIGESSYELGKKYSQLHLHLIARISEKVYYKNNCKFASMYLYWEKVYDVKKLKMYITKCASNEYEQEQTLLINHIYNGYSFL